MGSNARRLALALLLAAIAAGSAEAEPLREATTAAAVSMSLNPPQAVGVVQDLSFTIPARAASIGMTVTSAQVGGASANVVLTGGQTASLDVPQSFEATRVGGSETIIVRTAAPALHPDGGRQSAALGAVVTLGKAQTPGQYRGALTVIAQYN